MRWKWTMRITFLAGVLDIMSVSAANASPVPIVAQGHLVGVTGLSNSGCSEENCASYVIVGTIAGVDRQAKTELPTGLSLRQADGVHHQTISADWQGASWLDVRRIRRYLVPGQMVIVIGTFAIGREPVASEVLSLSYVQKIAANPAGETRPH